MAGIMRQPSLAGMWYPGDPQSLERELEGCFRHRLGPGELPPRPPKPGTESRSTIGLVSPHAGMAYSGAAAAHGYLRLAQEGLPEVVVVVGPNHGRLNADNAIQGAGGWETPLGPAPIHEEAASKVAEACDFLVDSASAHAEENSIELQVPFLRYVFGDELRWVPIMMADQSYATSERLGQGLAQALTGMDAVIVASSDLTHEMAGGDAKRDDPKVLEPLLQLDARAMDEARRRHRVTMCGYGPIIAMLTAAKQWGGHTAELLCYCTSEDVAGPHGGAVGYASVAVSR